MKPIVRRAIFRAARMRIVPNIKSSVVGSPCLSACSGMFNPNSDNPIQLSHRNRPAAAAANAAIQSYSGTPTGLSAELFENA